MAYVTHYGTNGNDYQYGADADADVFFGGAGDDVQKGAGGNDALYGDAGNDSLYGGAGSDYLSGGVGNDFLNGGSGADYLVGGDGNDTADYAGSSAGVSVSLASGLGYGGDAEGDQLFQIENLNGSAYNDSLYGNDASNTLNGGAGNDTLKGGGGDDVLTGGQGADYMDGGAGVDQVRYDSSSSGVIVDLESGHGYYGDAQNDTYSNIEGVSGSAFNDTLYGNAGANGLYGQDGDDWINGHEGNDILKGGGGNDYLIGGLGQDKLEGDAGNDTFFYYSTAESGTTAGTRDVILDFTQGQDHINLSPIDAKTGTAANDAFSWIGSSGFTGQAGQLHETYEWNGSQWNTIVEADTNGDKIADMQIEVSGFHSMQASDFIL